MKEKKEEEVKEGNERKVTYLLPIEGGIIAEIPSRCQTKSLVRFQIFYEFSQKIHKLSSKNV